MILYGIAGDYSVAGFIGPYAGSTAPTGWWNQLIHGRFEGSLGNPAYVDPYLNVLDVLCCISLDLEQAREDAYDAEVVGYGVLIAIFFFFFILGQTRGAFFGLAAGVFVFVLYLIFSSKGQGAQMGRCHAWHSYRSRPRPLCGKKRTIRAEISGRQIAPDQFFGSTAQTRFWVWGEAWKGFLERPVLGWGPENFTAVFDKFFNPNFYVPGAEYGNMVRSRAQCISSIIFRKPASLDFLSYLAIFFVFYWEFVKKRRIRMPLRIYKKGLIIALPIAYLVQGIAIFDVFPMYISLFIFLAFAAYYFSVHKNSHA